MAKNTQNNQPIPFARPDIGRQEIDKVVECMESGWLTSGPMVREFEKNFSEYLGGDVEAVSVNSATSGLLLAMEALGVGSGDEVITSPYTFSSTAMSILHLGATPVLADIDAASMNIDPDQIEAAITDKTKAIIPVHFAGLACDMQRIIEIARKHNLFIVEDAAHALPASYNDDLIGTLDTDATIYSFYATKTITTGEGGMIVTKNKAIAERCRIMRLHGISTDVFDRYTSTKPKWHYDIVAPGYKCNMTDMAAAIGLAQLTKADAFQKTRQRIKIAYDEVFSELPVILPKNSQDGDMHAWHLYVIRLADDAPISRDEFIARMSSEYSIGCSVHFIPINFHSFWQEKLAVTQESYPIAAKAFRNAVSLPLHTKLSESDIARITTAVTEILSK